MNSRFEKGTLITEATDTLPEIMWDDLRKDMINHDPDERMNEYTAWGYDKDDNLYVATTTFIHDEFCEIRDIEKD